MVERFISKLNKFFSNPIVQLIGGYGWVLTASILFDRRFGVHFVSYDKTLVLSGFMLAIGFELIGDSFVTWIKSLIKKKTKKEVNVHES